MSGQGRSGFWKRAVPPENGIFYQDEAGRSFLMSRERNELLMRLKEMGSAVEKSTLSAINSLLERDEELARRVMAEDDIIDKMELRIEMECLRILAVRQPVREEMRFVFSVLKMITDLERMGDEASNIAETALKLSRDPLIKPLIDIPKMAGTGMEMLRGAIRSFEENDFELAKEVYARDAEVDALYASIFDELLLLMTGEGHRGRFIAQRAALLLMIARHLERMGDHARNIAERSFYMITGKRIKREMAEDDTPPPRF